MRYLGFLAAFLLAFLVPALASAADSDFASRADSMAEVTAVRIGDGADKTRIVVDADRAVTFKKIVLSNPDRVVVDIPNAWISPKAKLKKNIGSRFVGSVRVAQFDKSTVRIVVETKVGRNNYNVFKLVGGTVPGRVVLDFGNIGPDTTKTNIALPDLKPTTKPEAKPATKPSTSTKPATKPVSKPETKPAATTPSKKEDAKKDGKKQQTQPAVKPSTQTEDEEEDDEIRNITGLKGHSITLDPGHGGSDSGAIGPTGVMEKSIALRIGNELRRLLEAEGATVYMTRTTDTEVSPKGANASDIEELQARCDVANNHKSDIFVSIHMDSFASGDAHGTTAYYYTNGSANSQRLAECIRSALIDEIGTESRGTKTANFYVVKHTDMPATLIEVAFVSNPKEEKYLDSEEGIKKAAQGIADGIADYFG